MDNIWIKIGTAVLCLILGLLIKSYRDQLIGKLNELCNEVEASIQGSGLGAKKKEKVLVNFKLIHKWLIPWASNMIDTIVDKLNDEDGWLVDSVTKEIDKEAASEEATNGTATEENK